MIAPNGCNPTNHPTTPRQWPVRPPGNRTVRRQRAGNPGRRVDLRNFDATDPARMDRHGGPGRFRGWLPEPPAPWIVGKSKWFDGATSSLYPAPSSDEWFGSWRYVSVDGAGRRAYGPLDVPPRTLGKLRRPGPVA